MDLEERAKDAVNESNSAINKAEKIIAQEDQKNFVSNISEETKQEIKVDVVEIKDNVVKDNNSTVEIKIATPTVDAKTVVKETPKEVKKETKKELEVVLASGAWQIQLISSPNKAAMEKAWNDLTKKYSQLKNLPHEIESADLGTKGTFYRLKAGSFTTRNEADKLCNSIKSSGGSCLVKKKQ